jgi:uncharacterized cysteine cluster protein YcgN (CxxCxxCC family)
MEATGKMIKFLCDSCGRDISAKVHDSVKQFSRRDHFKQNMMPGVTEDDVRQVPDLQHATEPQRAQVYLEVQILNELSKLIHACAWGRSTNAIQCGSCAIEHAEREKGKVITIFTRIAEKQMLTETPAAACSKN